MEGGLDSTFGIFSKCVLEQGSRMTSFQIFSIWERPGGGRFGTVFGNILVYIGRFGAKAGGTGGHRGAYILQASDDVSSCTAPPSGVRRSYLVASLILPTPLFSFVCNSQIRCCSYLFWEHFLTWWGAFGFIFGILGCHL